MSTNVYRYDERWYYAGKPDIYHGWVITTSGDNMAVGHFKSRKLCNALEKACKAVLPEYIDHVLIAACLAIQRFGKEADWQFAEELIKDEFSMEDCVLCEELKEELEAVIDRFVDR
jgi:hypothetical protein